MSNKNKAVSQVTRIHGTDADTLSDQSLVDLIKSLKKDRKALKEVGEGVDSIAIRNKVAAIDSDIVDIVGVLDARQDAEETEAASE